MLRCVLCLLFSSVEVTAVFIFLLLYSSFHFIRLLVLSILGSQTANKPTAGTVKHARQQDR